MNASAYPSPALSGGKLSVRILPDNPNHHLWNNNGTWWMHYTVHHADHTKGRRRIPLGTSDIVQARKRRDAFLEGRFAGPSPAENKDCPGHEKLSERRRTPPTDRGATGREKEKRARRQSGEGCSKPHGEK
jgi:hypothetical protein